MVIYCGDTCQRKISYCEEVMMNGGDYLRETAFALKQISENLLKSAEEMDRIESNISYLQTEVEKTRKFKMGLRNLLDSVI